MLDDLGAPAESTFSVKGVVTQRDISTPFDCCWVLLPRYSTDIFQLVGVGVSELPSHDTVERTVLHPGSPNHWNITPLSLSNPVHHVRVPQSPPEKSLLFPTTRQPLKILRQNHLSTWIKSFDFRYFPNYLPLNSEKYSSNCNSLR